MAFKRHKNRRRRDSQETTTAVKGMLRRASAIAARALLVCGAAGAVGVAGIEGYRWMHTSPRFALRTVSCRGLRNAPESDLLKLAGLGAGQNMFLLEVRALERAMAAHPWVKSVTIERRFPSTLWVSVVEHVPVAMVVLGEIYLVNEDGLPFKKVQSGDALDLPLLTGVHRDQFVQDPDRSRLRFRQALEMAAAYASEVGDPIPLSEIRVGPAGVALVTGSGQELRMGEGGTSEKLARLKRVREELDKRGLTAQLIRLDNRARPDWVPVKISNPALEKKGGAHQ